jgi:hypothetical protein
VLKRILFTQGPHFWSHQIIRTTGQPAERSDWRLAWERCRGMLAGGAYVREPREKRG